MAWARRARTLAPPDRGAPDDPPRPAAHPDPQLGRDGLVDALRLVRTPAATRPVGPAAARPLPPGPCPQQRPSGGARAPPVAGRHRGRHRHTAVRARIRGGRVRRRDGGSAQRRPEARPDAARPAQPALVPAAAFHRHRTGGGARRVARARPGHPARPRCARRAVDRPGRPPARRRDHHQPARNAGAPGERVRPAGRTGAHARRGPRTGVVRAAVHHRGPARTSGAVSLPESRSCSCVAPEVRAGPPRTGAAGRAATGPGSAAGPRAWRRAPCGRPAPAAGPPCRRPPATSARTPRWAA